MNAESARTLTRASLSQRLKAIEDQVAALRHDLTVAETAAKVPSVPELSRRLGEIRTLPAEENEARRRGEGRGMRALRARGS